MASMICGMCIMASVQDLCKCRASRGASYAFLLGMFPKVAGNET